jgi:hypothetical protein
MKSAHFTPEEFAGYRLLRLDLADILRLGDHLESCEACRGRLYAESGAAEELGDLRHLLSEHLGYTALEAWVQGSASGAVTAHLKECAECRAEAEDLRGFSNELRGTAVAVMPQRMVWWRGVAAAAAIVAAAVVYWGTRHQPAPPAIHGTAAAPDSPAVVLVRTQGRFERAPVLDRLQTRQGVLLGGNVPASRLEAVGPIGTAVVRDCPIFRWRPLGDASQYVVSVFNEKFDRVAESPALKGSTWQPDQPLPTGVLLNWQVTAKLGDTVIHAPEPPAPEARFLVLDNAAAAEIRNAQRSRPDDALLLATIYARAGALDDAAEQVERLSATNAALAESLRTSLQKLRGR